MNQFFTNPPDEAKVLADRLYGTYLAVAVALNPRAAEIMVAFGAVTAMMIRDVAQASGKTPEQVLDDYKKSLRVLPAPEEGK